VYPAIVNIKDSITDCRNKSFSLLASYFAKGLKIPFYIKGHLKLAGVLKPMHAEGLVGAKSNHLYLFEYLSASLKTSAKLKILTNHYTYFQNKFPASVSRQILKEEGITCWKEIKDANIFEIKLMNSVPEQAEGPLALNFMMNNNILYTLAFTFSKGKEFGLVDDQIIYITRLQGAKKSLDIISKAAKSLNDINPPTLLISAIEGLALSLGIKTILGINAINQLSFNYVDRNSFYKNYDEFWETFGSVKTYSGDYMLSMPLSYKTIAFIKSKHRSRTLNKRKIRQEISRKIYMYFVEKLSGTRKMNTSQLTIVRQLPKAEAC
jgi:uncharacterized protein VirK/YbjX